MSCRSIPFRLALMLGVAAGFNLQAEDPAPRSTAIIFSAPRSDNVSSNLNQLGTKRSSLLELESGLSKPFEVFESAKPTPVIRRPPVNYTPPAPVLKNQKLKDLLDKKAEQMYLTPEDNRDSLVADHLLEPDEDADADPLRGGRPKSALDRYYDRMDQHKVASSNQMVRAAGLFGGNRDGEADGEVLRPRTPGWFGNELGTLARPFGVSSNSNFGGGFPAAERAKPRSFGELYGLGAAESPQPERERNTRLDEFKRLLEVPGYRPLGAANMTPPPAASSMTQPAGPAFGTTSPTASPAAPNRALGASEPDFSSALGMPKGLPDYAAGTPSLTPTPPIQQTAPKLPPPRLEFEIPRRRF